MKTINVMYMCDNGFAPIAGVSITSLFKNNLENSIKVYLLAVDINEENCNKFINLAEDFGQEIDIIDAKKELMEIKKLGLSLYRGSAMTNLRLYFERLIPLDIERLIYIDCDTIVSQSLEELMGYDMQEKMLGMVLDAYADLINIYRYKKNPYYNAGVILIDCMKWRKEKWEEKIIKFIKYKRIDFLHPDQDIYNIVCKDEISCLPIKYNFQPVHRIYPESIYFKYLSKEEYYAEDEIREARENPYIIHMIRVLGENPWHCSSKHPDKEIFDKYMLESKWRDMERKKIKISIVIKIERVLNKILPKRIFFPVSLLGIKAMIKIK